ncbi:S-adenosylmethionine sensor upstream of mTORC1 [Hetaerina americana]|uniref:S-adenosylmethionine sensor upstream of mTORC1 n=1 Tax=Hetaerina americana TaxID=62018 RepID=UPI003A7F4665
MAGKEHLQLSHFIKSVHENLRCSSRNLGWKQAWLEHCDKKEVLEEYAAAMHKLATKYWESNPESNVNSRIEWIVKQCQWYFLGNGMKNITDQDLVKISRIEDEQSKGIPSNSAVDSEIKFENPLLLLDVGSCYNPFKLFPIFNTIAIDLAPATSDVFQCDFLELVVKENIKGVDDLRCGSYNFSHSQTKQWELPAGLFDVVNFSLFLEYLPSPQLRYECCNKAFDLLKPGGLLFIITPDSKHASANAPLMRSWRIALGTIGFVRIAYQKLTHLHCMAFRKCPYPILKRNLVERFKRYAKVLPTDMIVIPQDSSVRTDNTECAPPESKYCSDTVDVNFFSELPMEY